MRKSSNLTHTPRSNTKQLLFQRGCPQFSPFTNCGKTRTKGAAPYSTQSCARLRTTRVLPGSRFPLTPGTGPMLTGTLPSLTISLPQHSIPEHTTGCARCSTTSSVLPTSSGSGSSTQKIDSETSDLLCYAQKSAGTLEWTQGEETAQHLAEIFKPHTAIGLRYAQLPFEHVYPQFPQFTNCEKTCKHGPSPFSRQSCARLRKTRVLLG